MHYIGILYTENYISKYRATKWVFFCFILKGNLCIENSLCYTLSAPFFIKCHVRKHDFLAVPPYKESLHV